LTAVVYCPADEPGEWHQHAVNRRRAGRDAVRRERRRLAVSRAVERLSASNRLMPDRGYEAQRAFGPYCEIESPLADQIDGGFVVRRLASLSVSFCWTSSKTPNPPPDIVFTNAPQLLLSSTNKWFVFTGIDSDPGEWNMRSPI
jgi:hypothetical protein